MARFVFTLQPVYELRQQEEKQQKGRFALAQKRLADLLAGHKALETEYTDRSRRFLEKAREGVTSQEAARTAAYFAGLCERLEESRRQAEVRQAEVEGERAKLEACIRQRRMFEKLRQRQLERFIREEQRRQEKELEDAVVARLPGPEQTA